MTRKDYFIKKTQLLAQINTAEKLGCKNVLKCAQTELAKLEKKYKKEHFSNPLFSYMVTREERNKLIEDKVNPTFQIRVTFKSGKVYDFIYYHEIAPGVKHSSIEKWFVKGLTKTIYNPKDIVSTHFIMG